MLIYRNYINKPPPRYENSGGLVVKSINKNQIDMYTINDKMTDEVVVRCDYLDEAVTILDLQLNFESYEIRRVSNMAEFRKGIQYIAYVKWYRGIQNDKTYVKEFLSESHYQNWENFIHSKGGKVIGINKVTNQVL